MYTAIYIQVFVVRRYYLEIVQSFVRKNEEIGIFFFFNFKNNTVLLQRRSALPVSFAMSRLLSCAEVKSCGQLLTPLVCFPLGFLGSLRQRLGPLPHPLLVSHEGAGAR